MDDDRNSIDDNSYRFIRWDRSYLIYHGSLFKNEINGIEGSRGEG